MINTKHEILKDKIKIKPRCTSGVYFLIKKGEIIYVGSARNIEARIKIHVKNRKMYFDSYNYIEVNLMRPTLRDHKRKRWELERYYIKKFKPLYNFTWNPDHIEGKKEVLRVYLQEFSGANDYRLSKEGFPPNYVLNTVYNRGNVSVDWRLKIEDYILSKSKFKKLKNLYLKHREEKYQPQEL